MLKTTLLTATASALFAMPAFAEKQETFDIQCATVGFVLQEGVEAWTQEPSEVRVLMGLDTIESDAFPNSVVSSVQVSHNPTLNGLNCLLNGDYRADNG